MNITASQFPKVYESLGIDPNNRGCIMLDTETVPVSHIIPRLALWSEDDLGEIPESEDEPHVTLLYGLMHSGPEMQKAVDAALEGWIMPNNVEIKEVGFFYGNPAEPNVAIIAKVRVNEALFEGNLRLKMLPHIDTYPEYTPHITLAYVKDNVDYLGYIKRLNDELAGTSVAVVGLNYGH